MPSIIRDKEENKGEEDKEEGEEEEEGGEGGFYRAIE